MTFVDPDWLALWRELVQRSDSYRECFRADGPSRQYKARIKASGKPRPGPDPLVDYVTERLSPDSTVIDIGAASGRWSLRLAAVAGHVTAIEPTDELVEALRQNVAMLGATNLTVVASSWQRCQLEPHDVVINSHAMYGTADLGALIDSMTVHARSACCMVMRSVSPDGAMSELTRRLYGHRHDSANFEIGFNALLAMGIAPDVVMDPKTKHWVDGSLQEAVARAKRHLYIDPTDASHDDMIRSQLTARLQPRDGKLHWPDQTRSALMWWSVGQYRS